MKPSDSTRVFASILLLAAVLAAPALASGPSSSQGFEFTRLSSEDTLEAARALPTGASLRLAGVPLEEGPATLELRRIRVFTPGATLQVNRDGVDLPLAVPDIAFFNGTVAGQLGSRASLSLRPSGEVRGIVTLGGQHYLVGRAKGASLDAAVEVRRVDYMAAARTPGGFDCGSTQLEVPDDALPLSGLAAALEDKVLERRTATKGALGPSFTARIAVETDEEFLNKFGDDTADALAYLGDLFAYVSGIYEAETDTSLEIIHTQFWASSDPWAQGNPACALLEFGRYWNDNNAGVSRTIAHFFSGKNNGGGIAWVGVLCNGPFNYAASNLGCSMSPNTDNYGGAYGYTGDMDANFDIDSPSVLWDVFGWTHEVGHNFNSPHSHCYAGLEGNANPVDECESSQCGQSGCHCGGESLPCPTSGAGCGTIMSYCHLRSGGIANISLTFGLGHAWGVQPDRIPTRMSNHVASRASSFAGCLDFFEPDSIFTDGFESGSLSAWGVVVP